MLQAFWVGRSRRFLALIVAVSSMLTIVGGPADAQGVLSFTGQVRSAYPQSTMAEAAAAGTRTCSSISSLSRRCFFTFAKECKKRGESRAHCLQMDGFCHGCTDAYATCKGDAARLQQRTKSASMDCSSCNAAYSRCIQRMVQQYGGKLIKGP